MQIVGTGLTNNHKKTKNLFFSTLTMFADYRVPQVLAFLGVLRYSDAVIQRLSSSALLENGSELEVLIRAFSINACDVSFCSVLFLFLFSV